MKMTATNDNTEHMQCATHAIDYNTQLVYKMNGRSVIYNNKGAKADKSFVFRTSHLALALLLAYAFWFIFCTVQLNSLIPMVPSDHRSHPLIYPQKSKFVQNVELEENNESYASEWSYDKQHLSVNDDGKPLELIAMLEEPVKSWIDMLGDDPVTPRDTAKSDLLVEIKYGNAESCVDLPSRLPVDSLRYNNVQSRGKLSLDRNVLLEHAKYCPSDADPFLPWIHDVIPSSDGKLISFVAQNKRMCNTAKEYENETRRLEPQIALLQPISVKRIKDKKDGTLRYKITNRDNADEDGKETRFICVFHGSGEHSDIYYETLSRYPFNYEMVSHRKGELAMSTRDGLDKGQFWLSTMLFECPVPEPLQELVNNGGYIENESSSLFVDLVPIRTPLRMSKWYLTNDQVGDIEDTWNFDPIKAYGNTFVPRIIDSGRWKNIPICNPPQRQKEQKLVPTKNNELIACLWASASYTTRGSHDVIGDGERRLKEWIAFHKIAGVDHFYVYDNTLAHNKKGSGFENTLKPITDLFPNDVTWINWPYKVCNNMKPKSWNPGERSSQYAAEASCRIRYGGNTTWLASIDTDEYLIPSGKHENLKDMLREVDASGASILSFKSSRAYPRLEVMKPYRGPRASNGDCGDETLCLDHDPGNETTPFLDIYNCDSGGFPHASWATRAKKQIYKPTYVMQHFVHYSTVTKGLIKTNKEILDSGGTIMRRKRARYAEDKTVERFSDEKNEAVMLHAKRMLPHETNGWEQICKGGGSDWSTCHVGIQGWGEEVDTPHESKVNKELKNKEGFVYNCFANKDIETKWLPRLRRALQDISTKEYTH